MTSKKENTCIIFSTCPKVKPWAENMKRLIILCVIFHLNRTDYPAVMFSSVFIARPYFRRCCGGSLMLNRGENNQSRSVLAPGQHKGKLRPQAAAAEYSSSVDKFTVCDLLNVALQ